MALNFRIFAQQNKNCLRLHLNGDFDGSSACELINTLQAHCHKTGHIVIDTSGLAEIHPFGLGIFHKECDFNRRFNGLEFTGKYGDNISP